MHMTDIRIGVKLNKWNLFGNAKLIGNNRNSRAIEFLMDGSKGHQDYPAVGHFKNATKDLALKFLCIKRQRKSSDSKF